MKVAFDYLYGPVLGHKMRCEILKQALLDREHEIVTTGARDWLVYDYPTMPLDPTMGYKRLLMGQVPYGMGDYAWHPLGAENGRTLTGNQYIIVDPKITKLRRATKKHDLLITCGGSDPFGLTEKLLATYPQWINPGVVIGPNFGRELQVPTQWTVYQAPDHDNMLEIMSKYRRIVCAWGGTTFEALALGAKVLPITTQPEHAVEAERLGIGFVRRDDDLETIAMLMDSLPLDDYGVDTHGADRTVIAMEKWAKV